MAAEKSQAAGPPLNEQKGPPGGYDATPLPHRPPGYTVKITFHRATALPIADLGKLSSDPYLKVALQTALPRRHAEDPILRFRTHTIWRSTEPEWNEDWIIGNIPASGFRLKARIFDEDANDKDDRLGNVHVTVPNINETWQGIEEKAYDIHTRSGSWRAYGLRGLEVCLGKAKHVNGDLYVSVQVLGRTPGNEGGRAYTIGRNYWCKHYSPLLGRIAGSKEPDNPDYHRKHDADNAERTGENQLGNTGGERGPSSQTALESSEKKKKRNIQRYNFQANQMQLRGPVPAELYHRYVEFKPFIRSLFTAKGVRGLLLSKALHSQHTHVYNYNGETRYGVFDEPCHEMTQKFLDLCHFDEGARIHTYVITLDGLMRFTETGKEFGIDLLSKHTMHSDADIYIAYSGEFFIRRLKHKHRQSPAAHYASTHGPDPAALENATHPPDDIGGGPPEMEPPQEPANYELIIDNDSGTYRPNARLLPVLREFLSENFPGLKVVTLDCQKDAELMNKLKTEQRERKKGEQGERVVFTQAPSSRSSVSSSDEERFEEMTGENDSQRHTHKLGEAVAPFIQGHPHARRALRERAA